MKKLTKHEYLYLNKRIKKAKFYLDRLKDLEEDLLKIISEGKTEKEKDIVFDLIWNKTSLHESLKILGIKYPTKVS